MGWKIRRVSANWEHPKDAQGNYIPMFEPFRYSADDFEDGLQDGWLINELPNYGLGIMPQWPEHEWTHEQLYETFSEGTPVSPVMETRDQIARWLEANDPMAA